MSSGKKKEKETKQTFETPSIGCAVTCAEGIQENAELQVTQLVKYSPFFSLLGEDLEVEMVLTPAPLVAICGVRTLRNPLVKIKLYSLGK